MDILDYTHDAARESLARRVINYSPTICLAIFLTVYPTVLSYLWTDVSVSFLGVWGLGPSLGVVLVSIAAICAVWLRSGHIPEESHLPDDTLDRFIRCGCRTVCILALMFSLNIMFQILVVTMVVIQEPEPRRWAILGSLLALIGISWYHYCLYSWYWRCRYEKSILAENAKKYGNPVYVSIPIFKFCGHFVLLIDGHKYELRLDSDGVLFNDRPLLRHEEDLICNTILNYVVLVGWTRKRSHTIRRIFQDLVNSFGPYHRINNNCRHFLQEGCLDLLDVMCRWDENVLLVGTEDLLLIPKTVVMMWRLASRESFRFIFGQIFGPDWERNQTTVPPKYFVDLGESF